ncbi:50S ribosomal protein L25/general stress protein Ctc [Planomicrobium sp. CPCC 101110]|uniref:50S ribosomal protein L25/general stress protein Ctc n=1 Tax=Planomicrobium sp. CPCC 101110 TaxID=2599619 RepID=UPI0011B4155C|nr:50S ribosomal protein L25/general stress protein Ctc [Planomicrobium sp. CPCC 101110]TWT28619.1 50S ribosomal protein L25/general stress protein Ctc [Planomicrobium sp. CPCC 101110]
MTGKITAQKRESGKPHSVLTDLRGKGEVPGVVYGYQVETTPISVSEIDLIKTLRESGRNGVISLEVDGKTINVVLSDYQMDALKGSFKHVDFLAVNMSDELEVSVAVHTIGESAGEKESGVLNQPNREVTIKVKPADIPDALEIDVTTLAIGDHITVGDIRNTVSYEILEDDDFILVSVTAPRTDEELESLETPTGEDAEPEVIGEDAPGKENEA